MVTSATTTATITTSPFHDFLIALEAIYKAVGNFVYNECIAPASDDDLLDAGLFPPSERSPLLGAGTSPRPDSVRLATQLYSAHLEDFMHRRVGLSTASSVTARTPGETSQWSGSSTPISTAPSSPASRSSSYFDMKQPPLYVNDVSSAIERESKRRSSAEFLRAQFSSGFSMSSAGPSRVGTPGLPSTPGSQPLTMASKRFPMSKAFPDDSAYLTASLICLLHCPDLADFLMSEQCQADDVEEHHRALIDAFVASTEHLSQSPAPYPTTLDLTTFQDALKKPLGMSTSPLSSSLGSSSGRRSPSPTPAVGCDSNSSGAQVISHLLRSLHVALNDGEYSAEQPTYLRHPLRFRGDDDVRRHVAQLENMKLIQEDSVVRDLFEGLTCSKSRCGGCEETTATFEPFYTLSLPSPREGTDPKHKPTLSSLLKQYERPSAPMVRRCTRCRSYQPHTETKKIWTLPSVLIVQLPPSLTTDDASPQTRNQTPATSRPGTPSPRPPFRALSMTPATPAGTSKLDFPLEELNLARFDGQRNLLSKKASSSGSATEYDLSSESGEDSHDEDDAIYDMFALRTSKNRSYVRDRSDGTTWVAHESWGGRRMIFEEREVQNATADLLFYRRRD